MDGKQLKNSILQWAIQGKLVPQNPKDEPASKLLERIAASRNESTLSQLKGAKSKKSAPTSRIYHENGVWYEQVGNAALKDISDDIPFEIPENWAWCRLDSLGIFIRGNGIKRDETVPKGMPCVRYGEMYTTYKVKFSETKSFTKQDIFDKCHKVHKDDILMALTGENKWDIALAAVYQGDDEIAMGGDLCKFTPIKCYPLYLVYLINSPYGIGYKRETSTGDIIVHTSVGKLGGFLVPLPPLAEQKRIVAKLEQVLPLADEYGAAQEQLDKLNKELPEALKKSILQQAIQGKLVPQNLKDEPAQKLLDRITAACGEGSQPKGAKSKKSTPTSRIYCENGTWYEQIGNAEPKDISDEIPFDIPASWAWTRMGNIGSWGAGATPAKGNPAFYKDGVIPWLVTGELNNSIVTETKTKVSKIALEKCSLRLCKPGDVLIAMYGATIGKLAIAGIELTTNQACCACSLHYDYNKYLFYFLMASKSDLIKRGEGGAQPNISKEKLVNYLIPLPPLAEQKRIVAKLEQLFKVL